ncbi:MAG: hypothetical protein ACHQAY_02785 [Hyphomicrobiales bacterium]
MSPFRLPGKIEKDLRLVRKHWASLRRAGNEMPFWDDVKLAALPELAGTMLLIDAFEKPERFRFSIIGRALTERYGKDPTSQFTNEVEPRSPFDYITSQCSATAESRAATYYQHDESGDRGSVKPQSYARILLPLWGEGSVRMLFGAVAWTSADANAQERERRQ